jgi:hypothetical protein
MVAEMTGGYALIAPAMLANILAFLVQRSLTQRSAHPTLYESQVETREDSPLHRGIFLRRAMEMVDTGDFEPTEMRLPRLLNLLRFGESIRVSEGGDMLVIVQVHSGSELAGETVADTLGRVRGLTAVAVIRQENLLAPRGDTRFAAGDQLLAMTRPELHTRLLEMASRNLSSNEPIDP